MSDAIETPMKLKSSSDRKITTASRVSCGPGMKSQSMDAWYCALINDLADEYDPGAINEKTIVSTINDPVPRKTAVEQRPEAALSPTCMQWNTPSIKE